MYKNRGLKFLSYIVMVVTCIIDVVGGLSRSEELKGVPIQRSASARRGCTNGYYYPTPTTNGSLINRTPRSTTSFRRKLPPIEIVVECTLEELFWGCKKEVSYTRNVIDQRRYLFLLLRNYRLHFTTV